MASWKEPFAIERNWFFRSLHNNKLAKNIRTHVSMKLNCVGFLMCGSWFNLWWGKCNKNNVLYIFILFTPKWLLISSLQFYSFYLPSPFFLHYHLETEKCAWKALFYQYIISAERKRERKATQRKGNDYIVRSEIWRHGFAVTRCNLLFHTFFRILNLLHSWSSFDNLW